MSALSIVGVAIVCGFILLYMSKEQRDLENGVEYSKEDNLYSIAKSLKIISISLGIIAFVVVVGFLG